MIKALFLTTQFPYPLDNGGKIGCFQGLTLLSKYCDVTVLSFCEDERIINDGLNFYKKVLPNVHFKMPVKHDIHIRKKPIKLFFSLFVSFLSGNPYLVTKFQSKKMKKQIDSYFQIDGKCDLVFIDYLNMYYYAHYIQRKYPNLFERIILKDHNKEFEIVEYAKKNSKGLKRIVLNSDFKKTYRFETKAVGDCDYCLTVCRDNAAFFKAFNANTFFVPPFFNRLPVKTVTKCSNKILFLGNLSWKENYDGLNWFVNSIYPLILKKIPDVELYIAGSGPNVAPFSNCTQIHYLGYVDDISMIYDDKSVFICPLKEGSGIRIKILEAFNNCVPVVSTSCGCMTIGAKDGRDILIADDEDAFANKVVSLMVDYDLNMRIKMNAKKFLDSYYSFEFADRCFFNAIGKCFHNK